MNKDGVIAAYQKAINQIDDYFEYGNKSFADAQTRVKQILQELTNKLAHIRDAG